MRYTRGVRRLQISLLLLLALVGCAVPPAGKPPAPPPVSTEAASPSDIASLAQQIQQAWQYARNKEYASADSILRSVIASPGFAALPAAQRHAALQSAGILAAQTGDPQRALTLLRRACEMNEADSRDWYLRILTGMQVDNPRDIVAGLTTLAVRWPDALLQLETNQQLDRAIKSLREVATDAERYSVLSALFGLRLSGRDPGESSWWRDLALLQLARGERDAAAGVLLRVTDAYVAISVEADRRFDPARSLTAHWPSVAETAARAIETASKRAQDHPAELEPVAQLAGLLGNSLHMREELQVTDAIIERVEAGGSGTFSDYDRRYVWILDDRADALFRLGRWEAAIIQEEAASQLAEGGGSNVSQVINLAAMYAQTGKAQESLATLKRLQPGSASPFGDMQAAAARVCAAVQLRDTGSVNESLRVMREHRGDAPGALQEALLAAGREDEGAKLLISRLADPRLRSEALLAVQQYDAPMVPPWELELHQRWQALVGRRDVAEAIAHVGRVGHYPLDRAAY